LAAVLVSTLMLAVVAAPAFAFHHGFLPGVPCGEPEFSGGDEHNPVFVRPLPPAGTAAVGHSELIGPGRNARHRTSKASSRVTLR
jgi:hypothetical protein